MVSNKTRSVQAFNAIYEHLDTLTRAYITHPSAFLAIRHAISEAQRQVETATVQQHLDYIKAILNTAMDNNAPSPFFKKLSETRMHGTLGVKNIAQLTAGLGLVFYFELLSASSDFSDLQAFRERATDLKKQAEEMIALIQSSNITFEASANVSICQTSSKAKLIANQRKVINSIDEMIYLLGQSISIKATASLHGSWHALVASYHLFGNVSQASEITGLSQGVSGAKLNNVHYYQDN